MTGVSPSVSLAEAVYLPRDAVGAVLAAAIERGRDPVMITASDPQSGCHKVVFVNPAFTAVTGFTVAETVGAAPSIRGRDGSEIVPAGGDAFTIGGMQPRKSGQPLAVDIEIVPAAADGSAVRHWVWFQRPAADPLGAVLDDLPQGIVLFDAEDRLVYFNPAYRAIFGDHADLLVKGERFADIARRAARRGHIAGLKDESAIQVWVAERVARHQACGEAFEEPLGDGRMLLTQDIRTHSGGIVGVRVDFTAVRSRLRELYDHLTDGIAIFDAAERLVDWNRRYLEYCAGFEGLVRRGMAYADLIRARIELGHYRDWPGTAEEILAARMVRHREGSVSEIRGDGERSILVRDLRLSDGGTLVVMTDVTHTREREEALRRSQERFRDFIEASSDWFWESDAEHRFTYISPDTTTLSPQRIDSILGRRRWELDQDASAPETWARHVDDLESRRSFRNFRFTRRRDGGQIRHYEVSGKPVYDRNGAFLGYRGVGSDVTEEVRSAAAAAEAHQMLTLAIDSMSEAFLVFDADDRLVRYNRKFFEIMDEDPSQVRFGMTFEELVRSRMERGLLPESDQDPESWLRWRLARHRNADGAVEGRIRNGRWLRSTSRRTRDGGTVYVVADITDIKQREAAISHSEQRFRDFAEAASDWFWEIDANLRFTAFHGSFFGDHGIDPGPLLGRRWTVLIDPRKERRLYRRLRSRMEGRLAFRDQEFTWCDPSGNSRRMKISGKPAVVDGTFRGYRGTGTDVTARWEAERRASEAQSRLEAAIEGMSEGFALYDADDRLVMVNQRWREIFRGLDAYNRPGVSYESCIRAAVEAGLFADAVGREEEWLQWRLTEGRRSGSKFIRRLNDGRWLIASEHRTPDGGTVSLRTDITEIKRNEARLAELAMIAERTDNGVVITDRDGAVVWVNEGFTRMTGYALSEIKGRDPNEVLVGELVKDGDAVRARAEARSYEIEFEVRRKDGAPIWVHASATPIRTDEAGISAWVFIGREITRQREAARLLEEARDAAEQASRSKSAFLANISHELRTPLNAIIGFSEMMKEEMFGPLGSESYREYVNGIYESGSHLLGLINDVLDLSQAGAGQLVLKEQAVDVVATLQDAIKVMKARADSGGLTLVFPQPPELPPITADQRKLTQILLNLISNAIKFTSAGGRVTLSASRADGDLMVAVRDTGIGIAAEDIPRAFAAFGQIDAGLGRQYQGSGLGLPLSRELAELHGGSIQLESVVGTGTVAILRLPGWRFIAGD